MSSLSCPNCGSPVEPDHRFCPTCGHRLDKSVTAEERRLVTAVFVDLVGSTSLGERLDPEVLRLVLSRYFDEMSTVFEKWGGSVAKYVGDAVVAVFGLRRTRGDEADRALFAALEARTRLQALNRSLEDDHGIQLEMRSGVESGEVVASSVDEVVLGDVMNTAARLEQAADPGTTLVGPRTVELLTRSFDLEKVIPVQAKGKADTIVAHLLVGESAEIVRPKGEVVGRVRELAILAELSTRVRETGRPAMLTVVGEAGIGKSAVIRSFLDTVEAQGDGLVLTADCLPYGEGIASWPMRQLLEQLTERAAWDDPPRVMEELARLASALSDPGRVGDALALSAGVAVTEIPLHRLPIEAVQREVAYAWSALLSGLAQSSTIFLVFEDLHWAEHDLLNLIGRIASDSDGPILILGTTRPGFAAESHFESLGHDAVLSLEPLEGDDLVGLAQHLLPGLARRAAGEVLAPARGNPFFMEEIVAHLAQTGGVRLTDGRYEVEGAIPGGSIPDTIRSLLGARIDGLSEASKATLLAASVFGMRFYTDPLGGFVGRPDLSAILDELEKAALIVPAHRDDVGGTAYEFRHDLLREVAYAALPRARAARYHLDVAEWLEQRAGPDVDSYVDSIAHHLASAAEGRFLAWPEERERAEEIRARAVSALLTAGATLLRRSQWSDSIRLIDRAEALAKAGHEMSLVLLARARAHRAVDHFDEAFRIYRGLLDESADEPSRAVRADALIEGVVMVAQMGGGISDDLGWKQWLVDVVGSELDRARREGSLEEVAALRMASGSQHVWRIGEMTADEAHEAASEAFRLADDTGSMRVKAPAMDLLAGFGLVGKGIGPVARLIDQVIEVADDAPDRVVANELYTTAQWLLAASGDLDRAEDVGARHREEAGLLGTHTQIHAHRGVVELALGRGDLVAVLEGTEGLLELIDADGGRVCDHGGVAVSGRALALAESGEAEGLELFARFAELANPSALFAAQFGNLEKWRPFLTIDEATEELAKLGSPESVYQRVARCWVTLPLAATAGDEGLLGRELEEALNLSERTGDEALALIARWGRAAVRLLEGDPAGDPEVQSVVEELIRRGRMYSAWRLAADAVLVMGSCPGWAVTMAEAAASGGAKITANTLHG